ncbi:uncharacterized protein LOC129949206 [Eupeodes corollae]|uniref:uncharacterized protein LOC129949206 n=1 Tax=Eupeodes corollae TaxID=290404 RepID=UPI002490C4F0|nr:uncharacterized protein LOC129949206 [Eupeodes corollae]
MKMIIKILICVSVLIGSALSLHLSNDRSAESSSGGSVLVPPISVSGTLQHHVNNPYRRMAAAAESERERMLFMGGGRRGRPIVTGRLHMTVDDTDGEVPNYPASSLTMLQDNEFPIRREPYFLVGDDDDGRDGGDGGGGGFQDFQKPQSDHYHRYDDGSYEIMEDIFNRGEGMYRKYPPIHHQQPSSGPHFHAQPPSRGLQELFDNHDVVDELDGPNRRSGSLDVRIQKKMQRKRTQHKQNLENQPSTLQGSKAVDSSSSSSSVAAIVNNNGGAPPSLANPQEQKHQKINQQQQQQLLHRTTNSKRSGINSGIGAPPPVTHSIASQLMLRTARGQRQYDVPQIECPSAIDGMERFACPTPDLQGRYRCIDDHVLCDGFIDCPEGEDENRSSCMFYKTLNIMAISLNEYESLNSKKKTP